MWNRQTGRDVALAAALAALLPAASAGADETDRILRGAIDGIVDEFLPGAQQGRDYRREGPVYRDERRRHRRGLDIPAGHYPPPGSCRVWYPDRPPGHQPPPTSCNVRVPRGAVLIGG
jgi:hypothetical protein